jgi:hypothetical protein
MATQIVNFKGFQSNQFDQTFATVKLMAFTKGYTDLLDILNMSSLDKNGTIDMINYDRKQIKALQAVKGDDQYKLMEQHESETKMLRKQARDIGITCKNFGLQMHLRKT